MLNCRILQSNAAYCTWCKIIAINASILEYKTLVCFNYQNWLIEIVFIFHVTQKSAEKWNMLQFEQTLLSQQNLSAVKLLRCAGANQLARISYLLKTRADALGDVACCLSVRPALEVMIIHKYRYHSSSSTFSVSIEYCIS